MPTPNPLLLIAELSYRCPLHCPYCSNPLELQASSRRGELNAEEWASVFEQAAALGVLQLALTGGEPLVRKDCEEIVSASTAAGLYSTLVTAGTPFTRKRAEALRSAGLDHVQVSVQDSDAASSDRIARTTAYTRKLEAARLARELDFPLTINVVLHRHNLDRVEEIIGLAEQLGAQRIELANTQYQGWATLNRDALMPTPDQLKAGEEVVARARERIGSRMEILWVLPDYFEEFPKPCMGGWAREAILVTPFGDVLPCQSATTIPDLRFDNVRDRPLEEIWFESEALQRFRGTEWMAEPCRSCPFDLQEVDHGGCRCQALALTGDAAATDPVCHLSPHHSIITEARMAGVRAAETEEFVFRNDPALAGSNDPALAGSN